MFQPPWLWVSGGDKKVCKLKKAINDLKQSPRAWFTNLVLLLHIMDWDVSSSDYSIFVRHSLSILLFLQFMLMILLSLKMIIEVLFQLKAYLSSHFHMKDVDILRYFSGTEIAHSPKVFLCLKGNILLICWKKLVH